MMELRLRVEIGSLESVFRLCYRIGCVECVVPTACGKSAHARHCFLGLVPNRLKETPYSLDQKDSDRRGHGLWLSITRRCNVAVTRRTLDCRAVTRWTVGRGRLKVPSSDLCGRKIGYFR
ncbi:hypothetical protein YC2023_018495 [Brassica napus]